MVLERVFRNTQGHWVVGFTRSIHAKGSLEAEIRALLEELQIAHKWGLFLLEIETDCTEEIQAIHNGNWLFNDLINDCRLLMYQEKVMLLWHIFRQGIKAAHQLAKEAMVQAKGKKVVVIPPDYVESFVNNDLEEQYVFVKYLTLDACNMLANLGNQSVLIDTNYIYDVPSVT